MKLKWETPAPRSRTISAVEWNKHRAVSVRLYITTSLDHTIKHMNDIHQFSPSRHQYTAQLAKWHIRKYKQKVENIADLFPLPASSQPAPDMDENAALDLGAATSAPAQRADANDPEKDLHDRADIQYPLGSQAPTEIDYTAVSRSYSMHMSRPGSIFYLLASAFADIVGRPLSFYVIEIEKAINVEPLGTQIRLLKHVTGCFQGKAGGKDAMLLHDLAKRMWYVDTYLLREKAYLALLLCELIDEITPEHSALYVEIYYWLERRLKDLAFRADREGVDVYLSKEPSRFFPVPGHHFWEYSYFWEAQYVFWASACLQPYVESVEEGRGIPPLWKLDRSYKRLIDGRYFPPPQGRF